MKNEVCGVNTTPIDEIEWRNLDAIILKGEECNLIVPKDKIWSYVVFLGVAIFGLVILICVTGDGNPPMILIPIMLACVFGGNYMDGYSKKKYLKEFRKTIADSIEDVDKDVIRIRKRNKIGLYNTKKSELLLPAKYDYIEDDFCDVVTFIENERELDKEELFTFYLVIKDDRCGIYSSYMEKFILKCKYDSIMKVDTFEEYAEVVKEGKIMKVEFN